MATDASHRFENCLSSAHLFRALPAEFLSALAGLADDVSVAAGEVCVAEGDVSDCFFVIASGQVRLTPRGTEGRKNAALEFGAGACFGEVGFLTGDRRSATVRAVADCVLLRISREAFGQLARQFPRETELVCDRIVARSREVHLSSALRRSELFGSVDGEILRALEAELELVNLGSGEILFRRGDPGDAMYLVIAGRLRIALDTPDAARAPERVLAELASGDTLGEMAVLSGEPRSATVYAFRDTQLACLSREGFQRLLQKYPAVVALFFTRKMVRLMQEQISGAAPRSAGLRTMAVIPAHPGAPVPEFCAKFARALAPLDSTMHVTSDSVDAALGRVGAAQAEGEAAQQRVTEWLNQLEEQFRYVLYEADAHQSQWTERCLRQADHVLVVADADADPALGEIERTLMSADQARRQKISLVLTYRRPGNPSGTGRWLAAREGYRHHHVRLVAPDDFARIARFFTGRAFGLVLGGGFARGIAHIGVLRALEEANIPIDLIGGTSMGSMVAGLWSLGMQRSEMIDRLRRGGIAAFRDFTFPLVSFTRGLKMWQMVSEVGGDMQIEDLWTPYFCVSAILNRAEVKVHTRGSLTKSVLASSRAPGVFPPIVWDDDLLVDGGIINNVPVDVMQEYSNHGTIIAVDVSPSPESAKTEDYGMAFSGSRMLLRKLNPFSSGTYPPSIITVLMKTIDFSSESYRRQVADGADLYLRPTLTGFRFDDFRRAEQMAEAAYQYARQAIAEWNRQPQKKTA
ncbi:MAG: cyclic nucleotide-binding and patatin-like phospholipase domain-containing protein [Terriglobales bacterium]|jgi:NTE family protein/lysophospholipid hydrolase